MRFIRKFKEMNSVEVELEYLTNNYLSYLKDDGIEIEVASVSYLNDSHYSINIEKFDNGDKFTSFRWESIKDDFIQFIQVLNREYSISEVRFGFNDCDGKFVPPVNYTVDDLLNDKINSINNITIISIKLDN